MILTFTLLKDGDKYGRQPTKGTVNSACYDLYLPERVVIHPGYNVTIPLLVAFDIQEPYYIEVFPRSSLQSKHGLMSCTSIIDTDYKKGIHALLFNSGKQKVVLEEGSRVLQFAVKEKIMTTLHQVEMIKDTGRGGLGSTDA